MTRDFLETSAGYLADEYLPRLHRAVATLPSEDLWWRPHGDSTSCGNLLLHLEGNVRQWILSGLAGAEDHRERAGEFAAMEGSTEEELLARLDTTVRAAADAIRALDPGELDRSIVIQGFEITVAAAIYHVVEHFSWHTGQVTWIAKARRGVGHGLAFYDEDAINEARNR